MRYLLIILILASCQQNQNKSVLSKSVSDHYLWQCNLDDSTYEPHLTQTIPIPDDSLNKEYILNYLHNYFTEGDTHPLSFEWVRQSGDTAFIHIPDATWLSERSGSTGSETQLVTIIYDVTELPGIQWVCLDFEEGEHASPGCFRRDSADMIYPAGME